jgi:hypothetical protein
MSQKVEQSERDNIEEENMNDRKEIKQFDWNSKALTFDNCKDKIGDDLMRVLVLPTIDYFLPYLAASGFPDYLIQHPDIWKSVFAEFTPLYEKAIDDDREWGGNVASKYRARIVEIHNEYPKVLNRSKLFDYLGEFDNSRDLIEFYVHLKAWQDVLKMLAAKAGKPVAIELEQWMYYHYFSDRFNTAISGWWTVLNDTDSVPDCLDFMLELIEGLNEGSQLIKVDNEIEKLYGRYYIEYDLKSNSAAVGRYFLSDGTNDHRPPYVADHYFLYQAWKKTKVMPVLQLFARSLNLEQVKTVVKWAEEFYDGGIFSNDPSELCGDELITTKVLFSDLPSILDLDNVRDD